MQQLENEYLRLHPLPESDLPALLKIYQGTPLYFDGLNFDVMKLTLADVQAQWQAARREPGRLLLGVYHVETDLLFGVVDLQTGKPHPQAAAIWLLLIWGGFQRQGYGQDCMALLNAWLPAEYGVNELWMLASRNEEGLSFLQQQGFVLTEETAAPPIGRGQAYWMRRSIL